MEPLLTGWGKLSALADASRAIEYEIAIDLVEMRSVAICALLLTALTCNAATIDGKVVGVADGDTITVLDADKVQHKIRLSGIDAPEKSQPFGNHSKQSAT